jgi:ribonucleoside-diphosphate reductase alpha chain
LLTKSDRPKVLTGQTIRQMTGCGNLYVTINGNGLPTEVFATLGKNGGCSRCQNEALTRAISIGLRYGVPIQEYIDQLRGIQCPSPNLWPEGERVLSCPDAIARVLMRYIESGEDVHTT